MINSIGFTGSSDLGFPTPLQEKFMWEFIDVHQPHHVHHGDCIHADEEFHRIARNYSNLHDGLPVIHIHPPNNPKKRAFCVADVMYIEMPYLRRNRNIVIMSDVLLAVPDRPDPGENTRGSGTWTTIKYAKQRGIKIYIVYPDGNVEVVS